MQTKTKYEPSEFKDLARDLRLDILEMTTKAGSGHVSSSYSSVEILIALYFAGILKYRPQEPKWEERDRFVMSKGHAAPLLYAVLSKAGYFDREMLWTLREASSPVQGHPILGEMPGVEATTGSLGQGLSLGIGLVLGQRLRKHNYNVFVLIGDGECQAGQVWEAAMAGTHFQTDRLVAILDYNKYQEMGPVSREMGLEPLVEKWQAFGWHVEEVDGHDTLTVIEKLDYLKDLQEGKPKILICHTIKGKGVSFIEDDYRWHGRAVKGDLVEKAREEIKNATR
jgi:transketolase